MFGRSVYQIGAAVSQKRRRVKMTKKEALAEWRAHYLPDVREVYEQDGVPDYPARCESWGEFTDALCKRGTITLKQYDTWTAPSECGGF